MQDFAERETITLSDNSLEGAAHSEAAFAGQIPQRPYCSNDLSHGIRPRKKETALRCRFIQFNGPATCEWLLFDIDRGPEPISPATTQIYRCRT